MEKFERDDAYWAEVFDKAFDRKIIQDATVTIVRVRGKGSKLRAFCSESCTYMQFPRALRTLNAKFIADVYQIQPKNGRQEFYRYVKGSVRVPGSEFPIA